MSNENIGIALISKAISFTGKRCDPDGLKKEAQSWTDSDRNSRTRRKHLALFKAIGDEKMLQAYKLYIQNFRKTFFEN